MDNKELGKALLTHAANQTQGDDGDASHQVASVMAHRSRLLHLIVGIIVVFWIVGGAGLMCLCLGFFVFLYPRFETLGSGSGIWGPDLPLFTIIMACVTISCLVLAGIGTVLLILTSRRATMSQIRSSLAEICEQIRLLQQRMDQDNPNKSG